MPEFNFYNPDTHKGRLPVRVLTYNFIDWFENTSPEFKEEVKGQIDFGGFVGKLTLYSNNSKIVDCAEITADSEINLYENFNQYLWCLSYSLIVLFEEGFNRPILEGTFNGKYDLTNKSVKEAITVFEAGVKLLEEYSESTFFNLPNPELYTTEHKKYIEIANGVYTTAIVFILLHEYAHHYLGHLDYVPTDTESKEDEYSADNYAIKTLSYNFQNERSYTYKAGVIIGLCSLIFMSKSLDGSNTHPDIDDRLVSAIEKLELEELDILWGLSSVALTIWANIYGLDLKTPKVVDTYKELFYHRINRIKELKEEMH